MRWYVTDAYTLQPSEEPVHCYPNVSNPQEVIAYEDLGTEAIRKLQVENLPLIVVIDSEGNNLYETAIKEYAKI